VNGSLGPFSITPQPVFWIDFPETFSGRLGMDFGWRLQLETHVWPASIVEPHRLLHRNSGLGSCLKRPAQTVLLFEDAVQSFCDRTRAR